MSSRGYLERVVKSLVERICGGGGGFFVHRSDDHSIALHPHDKHRLIDLDRRAFADGVDFFAVDFNQAAQQHFTFCPALLADQLSEPLFFGIGW